MTPKQTPAGARPTTQDLRETVLHILSDGAWHALPQELPPPFEVPIPIGDWAPVELALMQEGLIEVSRHGNLRLTGRPEEAAEKPAAEFPDRPGTEPGEPAVANEPIPQENPPPAEQVPTKPARSRKPLEQAVLVVLADGKWHRFADLHRRFPTGLAEGGDRRDGHRRLTSLLRQLAAKGQIKLYGRDVRKVRLNTQLDKESPPEAQQGPDENLLQPGLGDTSASEPAETAETATAAERPLATTDTLPAEAAHAGQGTREIVQLPIAELSLHPAFEHIPRMRHDEWEPFLEDVQHHGIREPVTVQDDQPLVLLDGRHRLEAAQHAGLTHLPARLVHWDEQAQEEHVYASALHRRHLNDDQRAVLAARRYQKQSQQARQDRARKAGQAGGRGRRRKGDSSQDAPASKLTADTSQKKRKASTRQRIAQAYAVPEKKLRKAIVLEEKAPQVAQQVLAGEIGLHQAVQMLPREGTPETSPATAEPELASQEPTLAEAVPAEQPEPTPRPSAAFVPADSPRALAEALVKSMRREPAINFLHEALAVVEDDPGNAR
jgi:ParB-like chromosome segregation protein Spo0J